MDTVLLIVFAITILGLPIYGPFIGPFLNYLDKKKRETQKLVKKESASVKVPSLLQDKSTLIKDGKTTSNVNIYKTGKVFLPVQRIRGFWALASFLSALLFYVIPHNVLDFIASNNSDRENLRSLKYIQNCIYI